MDHSPPGDSRTHPRPLTPDEIDDFYRRYVRSLIRYAVRRYRLSKEDAADIVQETFLLALQKLDATGNPAVWLMRVVDHKCANLLRTRHRRADLLARWG